MPGVYADLLVAVVRPTVTAGIVDQRPVIEVDVLKREPQAAHEAVRARVEMRAVAMRCLLRAGSEIQRVEGECGAPVEFFQKGEDLGVHGNAPDVRIGAPSVRVAQVTAVRSKVFHALD